MRKVHVVTAVMALWVGSGLGNAQTLKSSTQISTLLNTKAADRAEVTILELLERHALHLAGHRYQIRYIRAPHARAHGLRKSDFDPM